MQVGGGGSRRGSFRAIRRGSSSSRVAEEERQEAKESVPLLRQHKPTATGVGFGSGRRHAGGSTHRHEANTKLSDLLNSTTLTDHFDQYR